MKAAEEGKEQEFLKNAPIVDIDSDSRWRLKLKTHIGKYQSEVLAFNIKKYFVRWKNATEEYRIANKDKEKKMLNVETFDLGGKGANSKGKGDDRGEEGTAGQDEQVTANQDFKKQFDVVVPDNKVRKFIKNPYNIYRPKDDE